MHARPGGGRQRGNPPAEREPAWASTLRIRVVTASAGSANARTNILLSAVALFELEYVTDGDSEVAMVAVAGELDLSNADELVEQLRTTAADRPLVIDLNRVVFIDSAALHRLFEVARERGSSGLALVAEPGAPVAKTLEIVQFGRAATVAASVSDACAALARSGR
jgi:anti-anti-sigma factor